MDANAKKKRDRAIMIAVALVAMYCIVTAVSIMANRYGFNQVGSVTGLPVFLKWLMNPYIILTLVTALGSRLIFNELLGLYNTSGAYIITAISFPVIVIASWVFFDEKISASQTVGMVLVMAGVVLVGR